MSLPNLKIFTTSDELAVTPNIERLTKKEIGCYTDDDCELKIVYTFYCEMAFFVYESITEYPEAKQNIELKYIASSMYEYEYLVTTTKGYDRIVVKDIKAEYLADPGEYPKMGDIPNVRNRYCFYQEYHKLEALAETKGLYLANHFDDGDNYWITYPDDPECSIVVWGIGFSKVYSSEDETWYQNITFEPSDQGLKQLKQFIDNYSWRNSFDHWKTLIVE